MTRSSPHTAEDDPSAPTGLPPDEPEETPLGVPAEPGQDTRDEPGPDAMPGIPSEGDPPSAG